MLRNDARYGLLPALLEELRIDPSSQILKWASGAPHREIGPTKPRAIYFRDDVAVAWFPGTPQIELAAQDPQRGTVFYTVTTVEGGPPRVERPQRCLACHTGPNTGTNVPGWQLHSGVAAADAGTARWRNLVAPSLPFPQRWQAWYISSESEVTAGRRLTNELAFLQNNDYPAITSDPAALLVRDHWLLGMNLLTRWSFEHQLQQSREETTAALVRSLLLKDELPLPQPLPANTPFTRWWHTQSPRPPNGASLRDLDLQTRTFHYAVSPLVLTVMVQQQPREMKRELYRRLRSALSERIEQQESPLLRETIKILQSTVPDWPAE